jgi:hypothetical protein
VEQHILCVSSRSRSPLLPARCIASARANAATLALQGSLRIPHALINLLSALPAHKRVAL